MDVRLTVIPGRCEEWPVWEKDGLWSVMCSAEDLDEAAELARYAMLDFLRRRTGWKVQELVMLLSLIGDTAVCQVVDPRRRCAFYAAAAGVCTGILSRKRQDLQLCYKKRVREGRGL